MKIKYYDIRVKNKEGNKDFLIMMNVHKDLVDLYISIENVNSLYENMIVYKERSMLN